AAGQNIAGSLAMFAERRASGATQGGTGGMMDIVFGLQADAGAWPDHGGAGFGASGAPVVGPNGLVEILETVRGLGAPSTANVVRIAAFEAALESLDGAPRFWAKSLGVDGWATARTLLRWRDELVDAGWN